MQIHLAKSDITLMAVDAVVNPANSLGIMGGGVSAALSRKGGPAIQKEAMSLAPIAVGAAVVTNAGTLFAKMVIHAPTMEQPGMKIGVENVRRATRAALLAAAIIAIGDPELAARLDALREEQTRSVANEPQGQA